MAAHLPVCVAPVNAAQRLRCLKTLAETQGWERARRTEAIVHALSRTRAAYGDKIQQVIFNVVANPRLASECTVALMSDEQMARGTVVEDIARERHDKSERFQNMVQEKYELASRATKAASMRCRRCGATDIFAEQKQTRGADEAMTVFCTCSRCSLRWTMR